MEGYCATGQSPHWAVAPLEEEEDVLHLLVKRNFDVPQGHCMPNVARHYLPAH